MKKLHFTAVILLFVIALLVAAFYGVVNKAHAATVLFPGLGGSGWGFPGGIQAHTVILGNGTNPYATVTPTSNTGWVLTSNGINADPTFQVATGGSGTPGGSSGQLQYNGTGAFAGVSTTTQSGTGVISVSNSPVVVGGSPSVVSLTGGSNGQILGWLSGIPTWTATTTFSSPFLYASGNVTCQTATGSVPGCLAAADFTTFNNKVSTTRSLTIAGTAKQLTSSAGAQDLSADRTWTLSLPSYVQFPGDFIATNATTTNATTTGSLYLTGVTASRPLYVDSTGKVGSAGSGTSGNCVNWGANNTLGDAGSACGSGGGSFPFTPATSWGVNTSATTTALWGQASVFASSTSATVPAFSASNTTGPAAVFGQGNVGIGTTSPGATFSLAATPNNFNRNIVLISSSTAAFATTTFFSINSNGAVQLGGTANGTAVTFANGNVSIANTGSSLSWTGAAGGNLALTAFTNSMVPLTLTGNGAGQTGNLLVAQDTTGANNFIITPSDFLGLGSTTPWAQLSVNPNAIGTGPEFVVGSSTATSFIVTNANNVGIGTTSPYSTLGINAAAQTAPFFTIGSSTSELASLKSNASTLFGLGTSTPTAALSVAAASTTAGTVQSAYNGIVAMFGGFENTSFKIFEEIDEYGHRRTSGDTPTISGGTSSIAGNDANGTITVAGVALTSVTVTFAHAYLTAPDCTESDNSTAITADISSISTTQVVFGFSAGINSGTIWYQCVEHF